MGRGLVSKRVKNQKTENAYSGSSSSSSRATTKKYETVLAKTKGYDSLEKKNKERRGRKKKK